MKVCAWLLPPMVLLAVMTCPVAAATPAPATCEAMQARIRALDAAMKKAASKTSSAQMRTELDNLSRQYAVRCPQPSVRKLGPPAAGFTPPLDTGQREELPEDEIIRRRELINHKGLASGVKSGGRDGRTVRAIPVEGMILIEGGDASTFYGKVKQEITYTIREIFVGNLIVTRSAGREDYALQTLSTEIDVEQFSGKGCAKYTGSPPVCSKWHALDLWQVALSEEYPGRSDGVASLTSDGRAVTIRAEVPDIEFGSSMGPVNIRTGCGRSFRETVSRDEFKQWLRRSTMRIKRDVGRNSPGCRPGSALTLEMHIGPVQ
jgi:hypothetical protein